MGRVIGLAASATAALAVVLVQSSAAGPGALGDFFFGPKVVRAEVITKDAAGIHDYRVDRGRIRLVAPGSLTLRERDGTLVTVPVAPTATVHLDGVRVRFARLRRGFVATTVRDGSAAASEVVATRR
jgi:hypothetical protein